MTPSTVSLASGSTRSATSALNRYLTIAVDHDSGHLIWATRCAKIRLVSADGASWIGDVVKQRCSNATLRIDSFHVWRWASEALDEVRREVCNEARKAGMSDHANELKGCRYALWRNPEDLTARQEAKLAWIAKVNTRLYPA